MLAISFKSPIKPFFLPVLLVMGLPLFAFGDDDHALAANSPVEDVSAELERQVGLIDHKYHPRYNGMPDDFLKESPDASTAVQELSVVNIGTLLDLLKQTRPYRKDYDAKTLYKRQILFGALFDHARDEDLSALLDSNTTEALWVVCAHSAWYDNAAVTSFLTTQLADMPSSTVDEETPVWVASPALYGFQSGTGQRNWLPSRNWEWTVLNLASMSSDPHVHEELLKAIQRGIDGNDTKAIFLCNALEVISRSKDPELAKKAAGLLGRIAAMGRVPGTYRVDTCVDDPFLLHHPDLIKDKDFDTNALAFCKTVYNGLEYHRLLLMARVGDSMAMADTIANYYNKDYLPYPYGTADQQQRMTNEFHHDVENLIFNMMAYSGSGDRNEVIKQNYRKAAFQDGHWVVTNPAEDTSKQKVASAGSPTSSAAPVAKAHPNADKLSAALDKALASVTNSAPAPPTRVTVASRAPIESLDATNQVTGVSMATVGTVYDVVKPDGAAFIVKDASGKQYRIAALAVHAFVTTADSK